MYSYGEMSFESHVSVPNIMLGLQDSMISSISYEGNKSLYLCTYYRPPSDKGESLEQTGTGNRARVDGGGGTDTLKLEET
jgi:hypothetical protein